MAVIHRTTLKPGKMELLADWLPGRPWYEGGGEGAAAEPVKAGGFRLDDPAGEVGIEFMVAAVGTGPGARFYHVPMTYRGAPLEGAAHALIGTTEHGVLGRRWVYDAPHDPVWVAQVLALLEGRAQPQAQSVTDTPDPSVVPSLERGALPQGARARSVVSEAGGTGVVLEPGGPLTLHVVRALEAGEPDGPAVRDGVRGHVTAGWSAPGEGEGERRGPFLVLRDGA